MIKLRVGVVGFGSIGRHHARNLSAMDDVELVGVVDPSVASRAEAHERGYRPFATVGELVAAGLDAAIVAVPTSLHEPVAFELIERDVALLVEKPLAPTMAAAKRIIDAARSRSVPLMVGYVERYNPAMDAMRRFVAEGNLGTLLSINTRRVGAMPPRINDANVLVDIGVHDFDVVAFITGARLHLVSAQGGMALLTDRIDYATVYLEVAGTSVHVDVNWLTPVKIRDLSITGTRGYAHVDYITQEAWFVPGQSFAPTATYEALIEQYTEGTRISMPIRKSEPLHNELRGFVAGVRGEEPLPDPRISLASLRIAEEATSYIVHHKLQAVVTA